MLYVTVKNSIKQLKGKVLDSITPEEIHLIKKIHQNLHKESFDLTKKRHIRKFGEPISKNKVTQNATNIIEDDMIHAKISLTLQSSEPL